MIKIPDKYILVKINVKENDEGKPVDSIIKLYSTWIGDTDYWRLNSGISKVIKSEDGVYNVYGNSSTVYQVSENVGCTEWSLYNIKSMLESVPSYVDIDIIEDKDQVLKIMNELSEKDKQ